MGCPNCQSKTTVETRDVGIMDVPNIGRVPVKIWYAWCPECETTWETHWMVHANENLKHEAVVNHVNGKKHSV